MQRFLSLLLTITLAGPALAQPAPDAAAPIRFPTLPQPVLPAPTPGAPSKLGSEMLYVVDSDIPLIVLSSPAGLVTIQEEAGPLRIRARFVDGTKVETRTFKGKHLFVVEALSTGRVELIVIPVGAAKEKDVIRKTLDVDAQNPIPPPEPPKPPIPPPVPPKPPVPPPSPSPIPVEGFHVMIIEDKEKLSLMPAAQLSIRTSKVFRDYLDANCMREADGKTYAYRIWDHKTNATADRKVWQDALARPRNYSYTDATGKAVHVTNYLPWLIISNGTTGYEGPLPANTEETIQLLKKIRGN